MKSVDSLARTGKSTTARKQRVEQHLSQPLFSHGAARASPREHRPVGIGAAAVIDMGDSFEPFDQFHFPLAGVG